MPTFEIEYSYEGLVGGVDEVGCGCLAGPVVAAAAIFLEPTSLPSTLLTTLKDSKKLSKSRREAIYQELMKLEPFAYGIGSASVKEIETLNIRRATFRAMIRAVEELKRKPQTLLIDGKQIPTFQGILAVPVVKGDNLSYSIAAASIIAKVTRDKLMATLAEAHPLYGWEHNAGYGTQCHKKAMEIHGITPHHRKTFAPVSEYLKAQRMLSAQQMLKTRLRLFPRERSPLSFFDKLLNDNILRRSKKILE